jgi:hypothetical protein
MILFQISKSLDCQTAVKRVRPNLTNLLDNLFETLYRAKGFDKGSFDNIYSIVLNFLQNGAARREVYSGTVEGGEGREEGQVDEDASGYAGTEAFWETW